MESTQGYINSPINCVSESSGPRETWRSWQQPPQGQHTQTSGSWDGPAHMGAALQAAI